MNIRKRLGTLICALVLLVSGVCHAATTNITLQDNDGSFIQEGNFGLFLRDTNTLYAAGVTNNSGVVSFNIPSNAPALDGRFLDPLRGFYHDQVKLHIQPGQNMHYPFPIIRSVRVTQLGSRLANFPIQCVYSDQSGYWIGEPINTEGNGQAKFSPPLQAQTIFFYDPESRSKSREYNLDTQRVPSPVDMAITVMGTPSLTGYTEYMGYPVWQWEEFDAANFDHYEALLCDTDGNLISRTNVGKDTIHIETSDQIPANGFLIGVAVVDSNGNDITQSYLYGPFALEGAASTRDAATKTPEVSQTRIKSNFPTNAMRVPAPPSQQ